MSELHIVVALYAKEGRHDELRQRLIPVVEASRRDEGSLRYDLFVDQADARRFVFVEHWASSEAREHHDKQTEHIRRFQADGMDAVEKLELFAKLDPVI